MKFIITLLFIPFLAQAEDLEKLFQREYTYLATQKNSYLSQQSVMKTRHDQRMKSLEAELAKMEKEFAKVTVDNEMAFQEVQKLESFLREDQNSANYLKRIYKNASESLFELNSDLAFNPEKKEFDQMSQDPKLENFQELSKDILKALNDSTMKKEIKGVYRKLNGDLVEGKMQRYGKLAVNMETPGGLKPLGPSSEGVLVELDGKRFPAGALYIFEKLTEAAEAKKLPIWVDMLATAAPIFILSLMFFAVCGLFLALIRE
jgi:hypothetical protein